MFYASHLDDYTRTYLKELKFNEMADNVKWYGVRSKKIQQLASSFMGTNKRVLSTNLQNYSLTKIYKEVMPHWLRFSSREFIRELKVDESRNIIYCLKCRLTKKSIGSDDSEDEQ